MIKLLDDSTIQKIAAGEVIERPSSIVKELFENSIDAGASSIQVEVFDGGKTKISLADNGLGIRSEEVETAFMRHATSKIKDFDDLYNIYTMGFRGEALASIVAAADIEIKTRNKDDTLGTRICYEDGKIVNKSKVAMNIGTSIVVEDIFKNIPVRRKFLKSNNSESNSVTDLVSKLSLANPDVSVRYSKDNKLVFNILADDSHQEKIRKIFGNDFSKSLVEIHGENDDFKVKGYISDNTYFRGNRNLQYIYLNNRLIESLEISKAVESLYTHIIPNGKFPGFQIYIETSPEKLDVNIHPNKTKVQLTNFQALISIIQLAVENTLRPHKLMEIEVKNSQEKDESIFFDLETKYKNLIVNYKDQEVSRRDYLDIADLNKNLNTSIYKNKIEYDEETLDNEYYNSSNDHEYIKEVASSLYDNSDPLWTDTEDINIDYITFPNSDDKDQNEHKDSYMFEGYVYKTYIFKTYLVFENTLKDSIILIDQHAAHERINYENLIALNKRSDSHTQKLLVPIEITLSQKEISRLQDHMDIFENYGFNLTLANNVCAINEVPAIDEINHKLFFLDLLDGFETYSIEGSSYLLEKLIQRACKSSIKANDIISEDEAYSLIKDLSTCEYPLSCPHGRPTYIKLSKLTLDKEFKRIK